MYQRLITCFGLLLIVSSLFVRATEPVHDVSVKIRIADFKDAKAGAVSYTFDDVEKHKIPSKICHSAS